MTSQIVDQLPSITELGTFHHNGGSDFPDSQPVNVDTLPDEHHVHSNAVNSENPIRETEQMIVNIYEQQPDNSSELVGLESFDHEAHMYNNNNNDDDDEGLHQNTELVNHMNNEALSSDFGQEIRAAYEPVEMADFETRPRRVGKRKSEVWKHFKIETVDGGPPVVKAVCLVCSQAFSHRTGSKVSGTSHLKRHIAKGCCPLRLVDQQNSKQLIALNQPNRAESDHPSSMGTRKRRRNISNDVSLVFDQGQSRYELARMIIMHEYPLRMVDHPGLVSFVQRLQPRFDMVKFSTVEGDCVALYSEEKRKIQELIDRIPGRISLALEVRPSNDTTGYVFLHGQFVDHEWTLRRRLLNVVMEPFPESDTALSHAVSSCLSSWNLGTKLCSVTLNQPASDPGLASLSELLCSKNRRPVVPCLARTLTDMARDLLAAEEGVVTKIRSSVKYVKTCDAREQKFMELKRQLRVQTEKTTLVLDKVTRWDTTYHMLVGTCELKDVFSCLDLCYPDYKDAPTMADWKKAEHMCSYLELLLETVSHFVSRAPPSTDVFFQKVWKIKTKLAQDRNGCIGWVSLQERFDEYWNASRALLAAAVAMDPRYKMKLVEFSFKKHFGEDDALEHIRAVDEAVHEMFKEYVEEADPGVGFGMSEFDVYMMETTRKEAKTELDRYLGESLLPRGDEGFDVLGWWKMNVVKYPALSKMARDVLSVPLSSVGPDRVFDGCARVVDQERSSLKPETTEALACAKDWLCYEV